MINRDRGLEICRDQGLEISRAWLPIIDLIHENRKKNKITQK